MWRAHLRSACRLGEPSVAGCRLAFLGTYGRGLQPRRKNGGLVSPCAAQRQATAQDRGGRVGIHDGILRKRRPYGFRDRCCQINHQVRRESNCPNKDCMVKLKQGLRRPLCPKDASASRWPLRRYFSVCTGPCSRCGTSSLTLPRCERSTERADATAAPCRLHDHDKAAAKHAKPAKEGRATPKTTLEPTVTRLAFGILARASTRARGSLSVFPVCQAV